MEKVMQNDCYTLSELAKTIGAEIQGDPDCKIYSLASLDKAKSGQISFLVGSRYQLLASSRYEKLLATTKASAVVVSPQAVQSCPVSALVMDNPYQGYIKLALLFEKKSPLKPGTHPSVVIGENCQIAATAMIGPNCVLGNHVSIGDNTRIEPNTVIGDDVTIGNNSHLFPNITIYNQVTIGDRVKIQSGAVIGSTGFGMVREAEGWKTIPHIGGVRIGDDVEIGANTTIDRGSIEDTVIENGAKLDNQIQVGHNVVIGENTVIAGCTGIAGSAKIGKNVMVGGASGIADNIEIADNCIFTAMAQIAQSVPKPGIYSSGTGLFPYEVWKKCRARFRKLDEMARKLQKMEKQHE